MYIDVEDLSLDRVAALWLQNKMVRNYMQKTSYLVLYRCIDICLNSYTYMNLYKYIYIHTYRRRGPQLGPCGCAAGWETGGCVTVACVRRSRAR